MLLILASVFAATALPASPALDARCQVWQRELSFAHAVQAHDAAAFAGHIEPGAVFDANSAHPQRGRATIVQQWQGILAGQGPVLDWYPTQVVIGGEPDLAYSSGPYLLQPRDDGKGGHPRRLGHFATLWHRGDDGKWRVLFDGGDAGQPASPAQVAAFKSGRQPTCPATTEGG